MAELEPTLADREVTALTTLERLAAERAKGEVETERAFRLRREDEEKAHQSQRNRVTTIARGDTVDTKGKYESAKLDINTRADTETRRLEAEYAEAKKAVVGRSNQAKASAKKKMEEAKWQALALFEAGKDGAIKQFKLHESEIKELGEQLDELAFLTAPAHSRVRRLIPALEPVEPVPTGQPIDALRTTLAAIEEHHQPLNRLFLPKFLDPKAFVWPWLILTGALAYPLVTAIGLKPGIGVAAGIAVVAAVGAYIGLARVARKQVARVYPAFAASLAEADRLLATSKAWAKATFEKGKDDVEARRLHDASAADERFQAVVVEADERREVGLAEVDALYPPRIQAVAEKHRAELEQADDFFPRRLNEIQDRYRRETAQADEAASQKKAATDALDQKAWDTLRNNWREGLAEVAGIASYVREESERRFLEWHNADPDAWTPPTSVPLGMRFGTLKLDLADIPNGIPTDPRFADLGDTRHELPALIPFPRKGSVLIKAADSGKAEAVSLLQTLMLRYITSVPPGKVRFTIVDPVGLGENFAGFMHLSEYSELLVTSRIWTETQHIEQRLADLSAHMENVIQKYLRNEFETIEEYNAFAGEVAEPFRILVVANFPVNFSESAARRLVSIAATGARCGVYVLISLDTRQQLPTGIQLKDLEPYCVNFVWREGKLQWRDKDLGKLPLTYDRPPAPDRFTPLMHKVGELARNANRVEVPFDFIAPSPDQYWTSDSRAGIDVPLGRAGATKLQHLKLGKGTSQHVLIAGKTGSGKSTLLHALITNAALRYSPDQLEMYLIDFKKGVEFKVYAALALPHARVIAVESEREFGLSVLQRLDAELKARGDKFRDLGVQDLNGYRESDNGKDPLPRILFIVDEFQEFFVEDDKIAQEVGLLLDRLVRQGRAFGIHVHLGSQSLGGAYSLARSTIGQMAVRVALQCSESDAHLILSEENSAARLLTRPGEAIYNDQNGMVEGNNFFQVVWLTDERREEYLRTIRKLAIDHKIPPREQIVFEGNLPAVASKNHLLATLLAADDWGQRPLSDQTWLGEAIAIKDPTSAVFRPQSGSNLLVVGQSAEMAIGMYQMAVIGLAVQHDPNGVRVYLLDGSPADSPFAGTLGKVADVVPHNVRNVTARELPVVLGQLNAEIERRQRDDAAETPNLYFFVFDLQRFRDLRKADDDFGFNRFGEAKVDPPAKLFGNILRDGPPLGVHTIVWCDSLNNLNRTFDRGALKEFEMRVLFQMSANDSSTLIDSPAASRLGPNRALFFSEEEGRLEKFRPYGVPDGDWLNGIHDRLHARPMPEALPEPEPVPSTSNGHDDLGRESRPDEPAGSTDYGPAFPGL